MKTRPYIKPQLKRVSLSPEEAILAGCKIGAGADTAKSATCRTLDTGGCCKTTQGS